MSIENPFGEPKREKPLSVPVSRLNPGDMVLENGVPTEIKAKRRSSAGISLELASGGFMNVDDENEEIDIPN